MLTSNTPHTSGKTAPGETRPLTVLIWIIAGFGAYWFLPWFALEYGLFDATIEEYLASLGWKTRPLTLTVPVFLALFILSIDSFSDRLPVSFYLVFGFAVSLTCGFQFPLALYLKGNDNAAVTRTFSADLIGAAGGTLFTSVVLIPYAGILWTTVGLIGLKVMSLFMIATHKTTSI